MNAVKGITSNSPSWSLTLNQELGLKYGDGWVRYQEYYERLTGHWSTRLFIGWGKRYRKNLTSRVITVVPERPVEYSFLYRGGSGSRKLRNILQDGVCLLCGEEDFLVFEYDHPFGQNGSNFRVTLCANCHHLKTSKRFQHLERKLERWLS